MTLVFKCFNVHRIYSPTKPIADSMLPISFNLVGIIRLAGVIREVKPLRGWHQSEKGENRLVGQTSRGITASLMIHKKWFFEMNFCVQKDKSNDIFFTLVRTCLIEQIFLYGCQNFNSNVKQSTYELVQIT